MTAQLTEPGHGHNKAAQSLANQMGHWAELRQFDANTRQYDGWHYLESNGLITAAGGIRADLARAFEALLTMRCETSPHRLMQALLRPENYYKRPLTESECAENGKMSGAVVRAMVSGWPGVFRRVAFGHGERIELTEAGYACAVYFRHFPNTQSVVDTYIDREREKFEKKRGFNVDVNRKAGTIVVTVDGVEMFSIPMAVASEIHRVIDQFINEG